MVTIFVAKLLTEEKFLIKELEIKKYAQKGTLLRIDSYKSIKNKQRKLVGEMLAYNGLKTCFHINREDIIFDYGEKGKPSLKGGNGAYFNISHSGDWVICGVSDKDLGVDIELIKEARMDVARRFFTNNEMDNLAKLKGEERDNYFCMLWTAKESYLKFLGTGLTKSLNSFDVLFRNQRISILESALSESLSFSMIDVDERHKIMVCSEYRNIKLKKVIV